MKPYRLYTQRFGILKRFGQRVPKVLRDKGIRHGYKDLSEAINVINYLWQHNPSTQYVLIDYTEGKDAGNSKIIAINMPEVMNLDKEEQSF